MSLNCGDTKDSLMNRERFLSKLDISYKDLVSTKQIHSNKVVTVSLKDKGSGALDYASSINNTDALITNLKNLPLGIHTADCLSIFIYDKAAHSIAMVHAGWRSTKEKIVIETIKLMQEKFLSNPKDLYFYLGPAMRSCCFKVDNNFKESFTSNIIKKDNGWYFDIIRENKNQILSFNIKENQIFDSKVCTYCQNKDYFSYRKEGDSSGRMLSVIMLKDGG
jgi:YfiH family protein